MRAGWSARVVGVGGEDAQRAATEGPHDAEVPFVESRNGVDVVAVGEHDQRCVGQAQGQVPVALDDLAGSEEVVDSEGRELVRTGAQFGEQGQLGVDAGDRPRDIGTDSRVKEVVKDRARWPKPTGSRVRRAAVPSGDEFAVGTELLGSGVDVAEVPVPKMEYHLAAAGSSNELPGDALGFGE